MAKNNQQKTQAQKSAEAAEAEVFGDGASTPLPVRTETSGDTFSGVQDVPEGTEAAPTPVVEAPADDLPPVVLPEVELPPVVAPEVVETAVFGGAAQDVPRATQPEQVVTVPMSVLEQMQRQIADLQKVVNDDDVIDPLDTKPRKKLINATFYTLDDGKQYLVLAMLEKAFPNGTKAKVYQEGVDQDKKPIYKAILRVADIETGEEKNIEVIYENFIKLSTPVQTEALKTNEVPIDLTPAEEVVEVTTYQERSGYVKPQGSGVYVRTSVVGKILTFDVELGDRHYELTSDVINIK